MQSLGRQPRHWRAVIERLHWSRPCSRTQCAAAALIDLFTRRRSTRRSTARSRYSPVTCRPSQQDERAAGFCKERRWHLQAPTRRSRYNHGLQRPMSSGIALQALTRTERHSTVSRQLRAWTGLG